MIRRRNDQTADGHRHFVITCGISLLAHGLQEFRHLAQKSVRMTKTPLNASRFLVVWKDARGLGEN